MPTRPKVLRLARFLLAGFATTVAIAWTLAALAPIDNVWRTTAARQRDPNKGEGNGIVQVTRFNGLGSNFFDSYVWPGNDVPAARVWEPAYFEVLPPAARPLVDPWTYGRAPWPPDDQTDARAVDFRGWPFRALWCEYRNQMDANYRVVAIPHGAITLDGWSVKKGGWVKPYPGTIPLRPLWLGLAADTAIFALAWWLPFAAVGFFRRGRRLARGQCVRCGYDLKATAPDAPCPECGATVVS